LSEWAIAHGVNVYDHSTLRASKYLHARDVDALPSIARWGLFHLRDWAVSSIAAGTYWLWQRDALLSNNPLEKTS
jgi:hypothetical protein